MYHLELQPDLRKLAINMQLLDTQAVQRINHKKQLTSVRILTLHSRLSACVGEQLFADVGDLQRQVQLDNEAPRCLVL